MGNSWRVYPQPLARGKGLPRVEKADPYPYPSIPYLKPMRVFKPLTIKSLNQGNNENSLQQNLDIYNIKLFLQTDFPKMDV